MRKPLVWLGLAMALLLSACTAPQVLNSFTSERGSRRAINLVYDARNDLRLDVYSPKDARGATVVVFFGGKRWEEIKKEDYEFVGGSLAAKGYVVVVPNYRVYPQVRFPAFIEDGAQVARWVRGTIAQYGGDPDKVFLMGHSAGAHIAAMLALDERYLQAVGGSRQWLRGTIGLAGPYDFLPITDPTLRDIFGPPERFQETQPIMYVDGRNPPMLMIHGEDDDIVSVRNSRNLYDAISRAGGPAEIYTYPKMSHRLILASLGPVLRSQNDVLTVVDRFLNKWSDNVFLNRQALPGGVQGIPLPP